MRIASDDGGGWCMSAPDSADLVSLIVKNLATLGRIAASLERAMERDVPILGRGENAAVMVAGLIENYYTCLETIFLRISQFFENNLREKRWHMDLLERMTLRIEGVRIPAVSEANYGNLMELLKFRHFRRYYFDLEYDWDLMDFLVKKTRDAHGLASADLGHFIEFLKKL